jgi:hypothetical protein
MTDTISSMTISPDVQTLCLVYFPFVFSGNQLYEYPNARP